MGGGMGGPGPDSGWFGNGGGNGPGGFGGRFAQDLGLSTKQQQQMHDLQFSFMKKNLDSRNELGKKRLERKALLESDPVEWKKVDQLTDEITRIEATLEKEKMRQRAEIKKILTPEQLQKFNSRFCPQQGSVGNGPAAGSPGCAVGAGAGKGPGCGMRTGLGL